MQRAKNKIIFCYNLCKCEQKAENNPIDPMSAIKMTFILPSCHVHVGCVLFAATVIFLIVTAAFPPCRNPSLQSVTMPDASNL